MEGGAFTDRREETERLKANFTYGVNTILISPRRMGKTSLVDKVCSLVEGENICLVTDRYSSYVLQLAWFVWLRTAEAAEATEQDLQYGIDRLLDVCEPLFIQQTEDLSAYQMNFLHALTNGVRTGFTQSSILTSYRLGTAANITRLKKALLEKDLITIPSPKHLEMSDPILALWLRRRVWKE